MKKAPFTFLALLLLFSLCSCGSDATHTKSTTQSEATITQEQPNSADSTPNNHTIVSDLPDEILIEELYDPFNGYTKEHLVISSLEIERRKTDEDTDAIWCIVELENGNYHSTKYVLCNYSYYDVGGWMLDSWEYYQDSEISVVSNPFDISTIALYLSDTYPDISVSLSPSNFQDFFVYEFTNKTSYPNADVYTKGSYALAFSNRRWEFYANSVDEKDVKWRIVGEWVLDSSYALYSKSKDFSLTITSFNSDTMSGSGTCYFKDTWGSSSSASYSLENAADIFVADNSLYIVFKFDPYNGRSMDDYVVFSYDGAAAYYDDGDWFDHPLCRAN